MSKNRSTYYQFGDFRFDAERRVLWKNNEAVSLPPRATDVLAILVRDHGQLVERDQLLQSVWRDAVVEEGNLNNAISSLRKVLGGKEIIQTIPRRGYRFTAQTMELVDEMEPEAGRSSNGKHDGLYLDSASEVVIEKRTVSHSVVTTVQRTDAGSEASPAQLPAPRPTISWRRTIAYPLIPILVLVGWLYFRSTDRASSAPVLSSFDTDEVVLTDFGFRDERAQAIALQPDGKIVTAGWAGDSLATADVAIARYQPNGSLDRSFDGDGKVVTRLSEHTDMIYGLAVQPDGKIIAVGTRFTGPRSRQFAILRYKSDGSLDASFDEDGIVLLDIGNSQQDTAYAAAVRGDGSILVAGSSLNSIDAKDARLIQNDFAVVRLRADGSADPGFGTSGKVITDFGRGSDVAYALIEQPDGAILVAGMTAGDKVQDWGIVRYRPDGTLDEKFGSGGKTRTNFLGEDNIPWSIALQADGKFVAAGYALKGNSPLFAASRHSSDGSLDNSFADGGKLTFKVLDGGVGREVFITPDGRIVIAGRAGAPPSRTGFGAAVFSPQGMSIKAFDRARATSEGKPFGIEAHGAVMTSDGDLILAGGASDGDKWDFALTRIEID